ncbi:Transcriptional regulator, LysR family [hydrothermal vent metagenome]|uniref:Transcriptional regulator, LysR family n=1 Tax=hydrothermal vent metagenome TaxID=652676 RepID=A0A3B0ZXR1_9ZZZZ
MQQYNLIALHSFMAVVEAGSFKHAAEKLDASTAAVSRRVSALENALGIKLLNRTTRQIDLTDAGKQFYDDLQNIFCSLDEAEERLLQDNKTVKGHLRIAAPLSFGTMCLAPVLPDFMKRYPELQVQLQLEDRLIDIVSEGIDIAIRIGIAEDSSLVASCIASIPRVFCASPAYLEQHGKPESPSDLATHNCLHYNHISMKEEWSYLKAEKMHKLDVTGTLSTNNGEVLRDAAIGGIGITLLPTFIVANALQTGTLKSILTQYCPKPFELYAVRPSRQFTPVRIKRLIGYLKEVFENDAALS